LFYLTGRRFPWRNSIASVRKAKAIQEAAATAAAAASAAMAASRRRTKGLRMRMKRATRKERLGRYGLTSRRKVRS